MYLWLLKYIYLTIFCYNKIQLIPSTKLVTTSKKDWNIFRQNGLYLRQFEILKNWRGGNDMLFQNISNFNFPLFYDPGLSKKLGKLQIYRYKYIYFAKNGYGYRLQHFSWFEKQNINFQQFYGKNWDMSAWCFALK